MSLRLPKIGNVSAPGKQQAVDPTQQGRDFGIRIGALSQVSRARMSEITNSGNAERQVIMSENNLRNAEAQTEIVLANTEAAKANIAPRLAGDIADAADNVIKTLERYDAIQNRVSVKSYLINEKEVNAQFTKIHAGRIEYDRTEVPSEILKKNGIPDNMVVIPAYMIQSEWRRSVLQKSLEDNAKVIEDPNLREDAMNVARGYEINSYTASLKQAASAQPLYIKTKTIGKVNEFLQAKQFNLATDTIEMSDIPKEQKTKWLNDITNKKQDYDLTSIETLDPTDNTTIVHQEHALAKMRERDVAMTSALTEPQFRQHVNALERNIKDHYSGQKKVNDAQFGLMKDEGRKFAEMAWSGQVVGTERVNVIIKTLKTEGSTASLTLARDMQMAVNHADIMHKINLAPIETQRNYQKSLESQMETANPLTQYAFNKQTQAIQKGIDSRTADPVQWAVDNNIMAYKTMDFNNVAESLKSRVVNADAMTEVYQSPWEIMSKNERQEFTTLFEEQDTNGKLEFMRQVTLGMSGDVVKAAAFWEPFKADGEMKTGAMAGQLMAVGNTLGARKVLEGGLIRSQSPDYFTKDIKEEVTAFLVDKLGTAFRTNNTERAMIQEAIYNMVAYDNQMLFDSSGDFDEERANAALQSVTGGIVEYNHSYIQTPANLSPRATKNWLDDQSSEAYDATGHGPEVKKRLDNGDLRIVGVGQNLYRITDDQGHEVKTTTGLSFEFGYYEGYPSIKARDAANLDVSGGVGQIKPEAEALPLLKMWGM